MNAILKNRVALITGTNRGIGRGILEKFAAEGATIYAHARKENVEHTIYCSELGKKYNVNIKPVYFEAMDYSQIDMCVKMMNKSDKKIDILVNNISTVFEPRLFQMTKIDDIKKEFEVNLFSQLYLTQYISRIMSKNKKGSIINISSVAGLDGNTGMIGYVCSKAAIIGATKRLAIELGRDNIRVNSVAPGLTDTDMADIMSDTLINSTLMHQIFSYKATVEDIANLVLFLASDLSKHITGQIIRVDGGMLK